MCIRDRDKRGKIINVAFAVSAAFVFGDHPVSYTHLDVYKRQEK